MAAINVDGFEHEFCSFECTCERIASGHTIQYVVWGDFVDSDWYFSHRRCSLLVTANVDEAMDYLDFLNCRLLQLELEEERLNVLTDAEGVIA